MNAGPHLVFELLRITAADGCDAANARKLIDALEEALKQRDEAREERDVLRAQLASAEVRALKNSAGEC